MIKPKFRVHIKAINPKHAELAAVAEKVANADEELCAELEKKVTKAINEHVTDLLYGPGRTQ